MRFSAISSRVKLCVSSSTLEGSLLSVAGRVGAVDDIDEADELQRKTLPKDAQKEDDELGMEAGLRVLASWLSTAAFTRYVMAALG